LAGVILVLGVACGDETTAGSTTSTVAGSDTATAETTPDLPTPPPATDEPGRPAAERADGSTQLLPVIGVERTYRWPLCTTYATMLHILVGAYDNELTASEFASTWAKFQAPPGYDRQFTDAALFAEALARGERDGDMDDVLYDAGMYNLINIMWATPCDAAGLPDNFGCFAPIDCAFRFVAEPELGGYGVALFALDGSPVPTSVDDCRFSEGYVAVCDFNSGTASSTFLASTDGRYFLVGYND
jgi:hypothetical protein